MLRRGECTTKITEAFLRHEGYWHWRGLAPTAPWPHGALRGK